MEQENKEDVMQGIISGNKFCQTNEAKWLCLKNIYQKFYRSSFYDLGGTYIHDVADYWFMFKTETVGEIFLLHLFVCCFNTGPIKVSLSYSNEIKLDKKNPKAYLPQSLKEYELKQTKEMIQNYITTYSFTELDVESLQDRSLFIPVSFVQEEELFSDMKVNHDFGELLADPICSDFVIESADGVKFDAHKAVLVAHSEVFKAMLKEDTAESQNNYVKLVDVTGEDVKGLLEFIYTGTVLDIDNSNFFNLLMLADQYNLEGLRELSQYNLSQQLTVDNALETLIVADMYNSDSLKQAAFKFIKKNVAALKPTIFKEIKNIDLFRELCEYLVVE